MSTFKEKKIAQWSEMTTGPDQIRLGDFLKELGNTKIKDAIVHFHVNQLEQQ